MKSTRRSFLKGVGAGVLCLTLGNLGFDLGEAQAYAVKLKIEGAREVSSICPFCSVQCQIIAYVKDGKLVSTEGDPDFPITEGALCAKGAALYSMYTSDHRLKKPLYRAPHSDKWEEKDWDWTLKRIARLVKDTRDADFKTHNDKGELVNRVETIGHYGSSNIGNEECWALSVGCRAMGLIHIDHQARV